MTQTKISNEIREILKHKFPNLPESHIDFVDDMVDYLSKINSKPESLFMQFWYPELLQVDKLRSVRNRMKPELIERNTQYGWEDDNPKNDYERGIYCAIHFIDFIAHCMLPD